MGKPCVLFCLNARGISGNAASRLKTHRHLRFASISPQNLSGELGLGYFVGLHHCLEMVSAAQRPLQCWGASGLQGSCRLRLVVCVEPLEIGLGSVWHSEGCFRLNAESPLSWSWSRPQRAGGISGLTAPGLYCRLDYLRQEGEGKGGEERGGQGRAGVAPRAAK